jgi:hypothetical protein
METPERSFFYLFYHPDFTVGSGIQPESAV